MQTYLAGQDITLIVPLRLNGEPFVPDANSVKWTLRDAAGRVVEGFDNQALAMDTASTEAVVVVPAAQNTMGDGRFSKRTVIVTATKSLRPVRFQVSYRLVDWINITVTPDDVRAFMGVDADEVPDDAIDIVSAYFDVEDAVTQPVLEAVLAAGDKTERGANDAVLARAVIRLIPSLALRLNQTENNGLYQAQRAPIDLADLELRAELLYADSINTFVVDTSADRDLLIVVVQSPDPFTGQ